MKKINQQMMKMACSFFLFVIFINVSLAQVDSVATQQIDIVDLTTEKVSTGDYTVIGKHQLTINDEIFYKFDLQQKETISQPIDCAPTNRQINLSRSFLLANVAASSLLAYETFKWVPNKNFKNSGIPEDKVRHFMAGYVVGSLTTGTLQLILPADMKHRKLYAMLGGFGASILVGVAKEYRDSCGYGHVDAKDAIVTGLGGLTGTLTVNVADVTNAFKKKH